MDYLTMKRSMSTMLLGFLCSGAAAVAQIVSGTLVGNATDATGAVVPKASVTATNQSTGGTRSTVTDDAGYFALPQLPPGEYRITVTADGFKKSEVSGIALPVSQTVRVDLKLEIGAVNQEVSITAHAAQVESETSTLGQVI